MTTAKTFAYAVGAEVIGVNTLAVIAGQAPQADGAAVGGDRRAAAGIVRGEVSIGEREMIRWTSQMSRRSRNGWLRVEAGRSCDGAGVAAIAVASCRTGVEVVDESMWQPMAAAVGSSAGASIRRAGATMCGSLLPQYYRQSAAEEKRDKQTGRQDDKETI